MADPTQDRMNLGRRVLVAAPKVAEQVKAFHAWMVESAEAVQPKHVTPVVENERVVALQTPFGRLELAEELSRVGDELFVRFVFFQSPSALHKDPRAVYSVRVFADGAAHFGAGPDPDHFEWDHSRDTWIARNMLRLAYELAVAATAPRG